MHTEIKPTALKDVLLIVTHYPRDERGFFIEAYHRQRYVELGLDVEFVQDNHSQSSRDVLRGLHYQDQRAPMAKLVRCTRGSVFDVAVDIRAGSATFGQWVGIELSEANQYQLFIPVGFAHGFVVLSEKADVQYKCSNYYHPLSEGSLRWDDPDLRITWPVVSPILSKRDQQALFLKQYLAYPAFTV